MKTEWREHPVLAFVAGWQQREVVVKPTRGAGLPRFQRMSEAEALALPGFDVPMPGPVRGQQVLPGFDITPVGGCPSWLLSLYDQAGGETERPGRGAPLDLRVFVGALLSVPETARDGRDVRIPITVGDLADWLYPNGWDRSNRRRGWESFRQSLKNLDRLRVPIEVDGHMVGVQVVNAFVIPRSWDRGQASVVLRVAIPASAARGARVNWDRLRVYGAESAPLYRAYLSACAVLDYSARNGHGITQQIGAPELNQHGKPLRSKDGRIIRSTRETIPNPAAKFVGKLTDDDVRRLVGLHAQHHENRKRARAALERLDSDGVIDLRTFRDGCVQIFAPGQELEGLVKVYSDCEITPSSSSAPALTGGCHGWHEAGSYPVIDDDDDALWNCGNLAAGVQAWAAALAREISNGLWAPASPPSGFSATVSGRPQAGQVHSAGWDMVLGPLMR